MRRPTLDLIDEIGRIQVRPFLAPILDAGSVVVMTLQEGVQFNYRLVQEPGWWVLHCDQVAVSRVEAPASMFETIQYLDALPRFLVIAVHRLRADTWVVVPWNESDASQRGWPRGEPRAMHLVRDSVRPFDVVVARRLGRTLLYDTVDDGLGTTRVGDAVRESFSSDEEEVRTPGMTPDMRIAFSILADYGGAVRRAGRERAEADRRAGRERAEAEALDTMDGRLRWHLAFMGAELLGWHEAGEGYEVRWVYRGREHRTRLRQDLQVASAGICLDGTDQRHNLSSIVGVMDEAARGGMDDEDW